MFRYLYHGDRVPERTNDSGAPLARYTTAGGSYYQPLLHFKRYDGSIRYPLSDIIGTAPRLVDAAGTATDSYTLDSFGRLLSSTGSTPNPYRFGAAWGYITDTPGSGLLQLGARFYWRELGRFIQQDPAGDGVNWYVYAEDNPVVWVDPEGLHLRDWRRHWVRFWRCHRGYLDISATATFPVWRGIGVGPIVGLQLGYDPGAARRPWRWSSPASWRTLHPYGGLAIGTAAPGWAAMWGSGRPTSGWYGAIAGGSRAGLSWGLGPPSYDRPWVEWGYTTPGLAVSGYYLW